MKKLAIVLIVFILAGCGDDDKKKSKSIEGTWEVTDAKGEEWKESPGNTGAGTIINTDDPDEDSMGEVLVIHKSDIVIFGDTYDYDYSNGVITLDLGDGYFEVFNVAFDGTDTMIWTQDDPDEHDDYEEKGAGNFLYYQKTWTLEIQ